MSTMPPTPPGQGPGGPLPEGPPEGPASQGAPDEDDAMDYFREYCGEVPERVATLADRASAASVV